jgi:transcription elongation factor GreA
VLLSSPSDVTVLTAQGRRRLQDRLARLIDELAKLDVLVKEGHGGAEELAARRGIDDQVDALRRVLDQAADVAAVDEDPTIVEIGDEVDVEHADGELDTYAVVDPAEADASQNRISVRSPLGQALLGARPGDLVTVLAPAGPYTCAVRARRRLA